ncbi:MAG: hypothetical protein KAX19_08870, partial [Candidatus Brocadiae bacterium]|nr:hypothetical protein [Candidatus Brocadiia bacterium]
GTVPAEAKLDPIRAEAIGVDYLFTILPQVPVPKGPWAARLQAYADESRLVIRPLLVTREQYIDHLKRVRDWEGNPLSPVLVGVLEELPAKLLWMVELSVPELFSANKRKVGEVLLRASTVPTPDRDMKNFVLARVPGYFAFYARGGAANPRYAFIQSGASGHVELFGLEDG